MENSKDATRRLGKGWGDRGDPEGWVEEFYAQAEGDINRERHPNVDSKGKGRR